MRWLTSLVNSSIIWQISISAINFVDLWATVHSVPLSDYRPAARYPRRCPLASTSPCSSQRVSACLNSERAIKIWGENGKNIFNKCIQQITSAIKLPDNVIIMPEEESLFLIPQIIHNTNSSDEIYNFSGSGVEKIASTLMSPVSVYPF